MREVKARERDGRSSDGVRVFFFDNGWGFAFIRDTLTADNFAWNPVRHDRESEDYQLILWSVKFNDSLQELKRMWELYGEVMEWPFDLDFIRDEIDDAAGEERFIVMAYYMAKLPAWMAEDGRLTFIRPKNGYFAEGYLDRVSRQILREYIVEPDKMKSDVLLEILCDRLEETMPEEEYL